MANEILKIDNELNHLQFKNFNESDLKLFMYVCWQFSSVDGEVLSLNIPYEKLGNILTSLDGNKKKIKNDVKNMIRKQAGILFIHGEEYIIPFPYYNFDDDDFFEVHINHMFIPKIKDLLGNFTVLELNVYNSIKGKYTKLFYQHLRRFKKTGYWKLSLFDFKLLMDTPKSYSVSKLDSKIIKPCLQELKPYFNNLKFKKIYGKRNGKQILAGYEFTFDRILKDNSQFVDPNYDYSSEPPDDKMLEYIQEHLYNNEK